ncbi:Aldo/keto reductase [Aulographum hederae CBS 113979]|uniref:Aldo/keto reductase n=1 Tax=Aulographum hederae CBS 113979 TaxID=1176131 RepID=A0A6G1GWZ1_9PEZI|nr:Aldo/keto reductase [Aulographum hederae CBS 113979]
MRSLRLLPIFLTSVTSFHTRIEQQPIPNPVPDQMIPVSTDINPPNAVTDIPPIGLGTWELRVSPENTTDAVAYAIEAGYRHIDAAMAYNNQEAVGKGIHKGLKKAGLKREDIWVTSKLWNDNHGTFEAVETDFNKTLSLLNLTYLDLYHMHWPIGHSPDNSTFDYLTTWNSMTQLLSTNRVRHLGICNFAPEQLRVLTTSSTVKPYSHQFELHLYLPQPWWLSWHKRLGIKVTAYSPLGNMNPVYHDRLPKGQPKLLNHTIVKDIAKRRGCAPAQVVLAWNLQRGVDSVIPKSSHPQWIDENLRAWECRLLEKDFSKLEGLGEEWESRFNNPSKNWGVQLFKGLDGL